MFYLEYNQTSQKSDIVDTLVDIRYDLIMVFVFCHFHFWRLKFDRDPLVTWPIKCNSEGLNMFTRVDYVQNTPMDKE